MDWDTFLRSEVDGLVLFSGKAFYPSVRAMLDALEEVSSRGYVILGLEGLNTDGVHVTPSLDHIADFSSIHGTRGDRAERSIVAARSLLEQWLGGVQFVDVTVEDRDAGLGTTQGD